MAQENKLQSTSKEIIQNYKFTFAKYEFSIWEKRIIYNILRSTELQETLKHKIISVPDSTTRTTLDNNKLVKFVIPLSDISKYTGEEQEPDAGTYKDIKKALYDLDEKSFVYEDENSWFKARLITLPEITKYSGKVEFYMKKEIWDFLTDISKGYRRFDFEIVMSLKSIYAMRFYEMFAHQDENQNGGIFFYKIEQLREYFQTGNKYPYNANFIDRVIKSAQKELSAVANYSFTFTPRKSKGSRAFDYIEFHVIHIPENEKNIANRENRDKQLLAKNVRIDNELYTKLQTDFNFTTEEIHSNLATFYICEFEYKKKYGNLGVTYLLVKLDEIKQRGLQKRVDNIKGYMIKAIQGEQDIMQKERREERVKAIQEIKEWQKGISCDDPRAKDFINPHGDD